MRPTTRSRPAPAACRRPARVSSPAGPPPPRRRCPRSSSPRCSTPTAMRSPAGRASPPPRSSSSRCGGTCGCAPGRGGCGPSATGVRRASGHGTDPPGAPSRGSAQGPWKTRIMRFAIKTSPQNTTWADMLAVWQAADEIELFESARTFDHFYPIFTDDVSGDCMEGWITLTALAQATRRLRLGVLVSATPYRHPAVLAKMATTVDIISGGRLELGIGAGWNLVEASAYHFGLREDLTERFDAFDEVCEALIGLLTNERTTYAGRYVQLTDAYCNPKPIQQPHPPICIGGQGERRTLRSVARFAQHWNFPGGTAEQFAAKLDVLRAHCAELGRDPSEITVSAHLIGLRFGSGIDAVVEEAKRYADAGLDLGPVSLPTPYRTELLDDLAAALSDL